MEIQFKEEEGGMTNKLDKTLYALEMGACKLKL